ncbi:putative glycosyl hydrolase family 5 protein [Phytophthora cinnamomi]|uniref:putative glycosyl hydrolase family 5 protein n=1 Tax=Phytophthora cinnamomi TaxID=4785 RepID=UPI00355A795A|nr:putative glycosyl hydrolase family 5 protein [Phytophthora cinnamomi]
MGERSIGNPTDEFTIIQNMSNFRELYRKQLAMYNEDLSGGWAFWSWRHSDDATKRTGWSMRKVIRDGDLKL